MSKSDKARQVMRAFYFANKSLDAAAKSLYYPDSVRDALAASMYASLRAELTNTPWQVFSATKPVIDKRRARRYHRNHIKSVRSNKSHLIVEVMVDESKLQEGVVNYG